MEASLKEEGGAVISSMAREVSSSQTEVTIEFGEVPVGTKVKVEVFFYSVEDDGTFSSTPAKTGSSGYFVVKSGVNTIQVNITDVGGGGSTGDGGSSGNDGGEGTTTSYTVTFISDGATLDTQTVEAGKTASAPEEPTKEGYTLLGWYTNTDGSGDKFDFTTKITADTTLYAQWDIIVYKVTFDTNASTLGDDVSVAGEMPAQEIEYGSSGTKLTKNTFTATGYTFTGWNTQSDGGGTSYDDEAEIAGLTTDTTLYAQWVATISTWSDLKTALEQAEEDGENGVTLYIDGDMEATEEISISKDTTIIVVDDVTITRGESFTDIFLSTTAALTIKPLDDNEATITFDGNKDTIDATSPFIKATRNLDLSGCVFKDNKNTNTDGGAIFVNNTSDEISVTVTDCSFESNSVTGSSCAGGAVAIYGGYISSTMTNCSFNGNTAAGSGGGALYIYGTTVQDTTYTHTLIGCDFTGNVSTFESYNYGGAVWLQRGKLFLDNVTMSGNKYNDTNSDIAMYYIYAYAVLKNKNKIDAFIPMFGSSDCSKIQLGDSFDTENTKISFVCTTSSGGSIEEKSFITGANTTLTQEQLACFTSITDSDGNNYTLNANGTVTAATTD